MDLELQGARVVPFNEALVVAQVAGLASTASVSAYAELTFGVGNKVTLLIQLTPTGPLTPLPLLRSSAD